MTKKQKKYKKLPGSRKKVIGRDTLWASSDHLLQVRSSGMTESYRRFYFTDIKSAFITVTRSPMIENTLLALLSVLLIILGIYGWGTFHEAMIPLWIISAVLIAYIIINGVKGNFCDFFIETPIGIEKIHVANREKKATRLLDEIVSLVENVQGSLTEEDIEKVTQEIKDAPFRKMLLLKDIKTTWHKWLFSTMVVAGLFEFALIYFRNKPLIILGFVPFLAMSICSIVAIVKQIGSNLAKPLKILTWGTIVLVMLSFAMGYIEMFIVMISNMDPQSMNNQLLLLDAIVKHDPRDNLFTFCWQMFFIMSSIGMGLTGLLMIRKK